MVNPLSRRELLKKSLAGFGALSLPVGLTACGDQDDPSSDDSSVHQVRFLHGVASGDPLQDRVILWTRLTVDDQLMKPVVTWEIALDEKFSQIVNSARVQTSQHQDFTVKVDATGLKAHQRYFYRFKCAGVVSSVGQTKTLPIEAQRVSFAVCSCSNYPAGYFYVYREIAKQDVDVVLHLGDYIYEYGQSGYASDEAAQLGRLLAEDNQQEIIKLDDYRKRYALYRADTDLQAAHQRHPFIVIWDDHELTNNTWEFGAKNHQPNEGSFSERKIAALQAYFEWMPIRPVSENNHLNIYRQFEFGNLLSLTMLDTRIIARNEQLDYAQYLGEAGLDQERFKADLTDKKRTLLGFVQRDWLEKSLINSKAIWHVLGQQVLMSKMLIPAELLFAIREVTSGKATPETLNRLALKMNELVGLKRKLLAGDPTLTDAEKARITTVAPYNLDAWDGYYAEREYVYATLEKLNKKVVVLAGDTHNAWTSSLHSQSGVHVGEEFAVAAISSPGMEKYLHIPPKDLALYEMAYSTLIDELNFCNLNQRGYLKVSFTKDEVLAEWIFVSSVKEKSYTIDQMCGKTLLLDRDLKEISAMQKIA